MKMEAASSLNERRQFLLEVLRQCLVSIRVKSVLFHFELSDDPTSIRSSLYRATVDVLDSMIDAIESNDVPSDSSFFQRALSMATTTASSTTGTTPVDTKSQLFESGGSVGSAGGRTGGPLSTSSRKEEEEKEETSSLSKFQATITFQQQQIEILQQQLEERDNAYRVLEETCRESEGRVNRLEQELLRVAASMSSQQQQQREQGDLSGASPQSPTSPSRRTGAFASYLARHEAVTSLEAQLKESSAQNQGLMGLLMLLLGVKTKKKRGDHGETKKEDSLRTTDTTNNAVACSRLQTFSGTMRKLLAQHATMNAMAYLPNLSPLVDPDDMIWEDEEEDDANDAEDPHKENRALRRVEAWLAQCEASLAPPQQQQHQAHPLPPPPPPAASFLSYLAEAVDPTCWTVIAECKDSELRMLYQALEQCENRVLRVVQWKQYAKSLRRYARHLRRATIAMANTQQHQQRGYPCPPPPSSHPHSPDEDGDGGDSSYSDWTTPNGSVASHGGLAPSSSSLSRGAAAELSLGPTRSRDPTLLAVTSVVSSALGWATSQQNPLLNRAGVVGSHRGRSREHSSAGPAIASSNRHASHFTFPSPPSRPQFSSDSSASSASSASSDEAVDNEAQHTAGTSNKQPQQQRAWKQDTAKHHKHAKKRSAKQLASEKAAASAASRSMTMLSSDATRLKIMKTLRRQNTILHTKLAQILVEQQKLYWYLCVATIHPPPLPPSSSASPSSESMIAQLRRHQESLDREVERRSELLRETFLLREQELDLLHRSYQGLATRLLQAEDAIQHAIRQLQVARVPLAPALEAYFPSQLGSGKTTDLTARDAARRRGLSTSNSSSAAATAAVEELQSQQQAAIDQERSRASLMLQLAQEEEEFRQADRAVRFLESQMMEVNERELSNPHGLKTIDPRWSLAVQEELATALRKRDALAADVGLLDSYCSTFVNELKLLREVLGKSLQRVAGGGEAGGGANGGATVSHSAMGYKGGSSSARPRGDSILDALKRKIDSL